MKRTATARTIKVTVIIAVFVAAVLFAETELSQVGTDLEKRREASIRDAVLRSALQCYAVEGVYPDSLDYLEDTYGLMINHDKYIVSYECYASNRPPEIKVLKK